MFKNLVLAGVAVVALVTSAQAEEVYYNDALPAVVDMEGQPSADDLAYISKRCAGLYMHNAVRLEAALDGGDNRVSQELIDGYYNAVDNFMTVPVRVSVQRGYRVEESIEIVGAEVERHLNTYINHSQRARHQTGHFSADPIIRVDGEFCKMVYTVLFSE